MTKNADLLMRVDELGNEFTRSMSRLHFLFEGIAHTESSLDDEATREKLENALNEQRNELNEILKRYREIEDELYKEARESQEPPTESRREITFKASGE